MATRPSSRPGGISRPHPAAPTGELRASADKARAAETNASVRTSEISSLTTLEERALFPRGSRGDQRIDAIGLERPYGTRPRTFRTLRVRTAREKACTLAGPSAARHVVRTTRP